LIETVQLTEDCFEVGVDVVFRAYITFIAVIFIIIISITFMYKRQEQGCNIL